MRLMSNTMMNKGCSLQRKSVEDPMEEKSVSTMQPNQKMSTRQSKRLQMNRCARVMSPLSALFMSLKMKPKKE